jgi:AI-2 transport protein TqsA
LRFFALALGFLHPCNRHAAAGGRMTTDNGRPRASAGLELVALLILAATALGAVLYFLRPVLMPLVLAILLAYVVSPLVDTLHLRLRLPRPLALLLAFLAVVGAAVGMGWLVVSSVQDAALRAPFYQERLARLLEEATLWLDHVGLAVDAASVEKRLQELPVSSYLLDTANALLAWVVNGVLVLIFVAYLVVGRKASPQHSGLLREIDAKVKRYLLAKMASSLVSGVLVGSLLALVGVDLALLFGLMAFLLNFVPSVGAVLATLLPLPVALVQFDSTFPIVLAVALPGAVQFVIGYLLEPRLFGSLLELHPITVLGSLIFWGMLWGVMGMVLAAPITAVIRIVLDHIDATRPVANVLAGRW